MNLQRQLRILCALALVGRFGLAGPIWVVLLAGRGLSLGEIGLAEGFFHLVSFCCEVPSGMLADFIGRKRTLALSYGVGALSGLCMLASQGMLGVCLAMGATALAYNLASGTQEALVYESLLQAGCPQRYAGLAGRLSALGRMMETVCTLLAGLTLWMGWRNAYTLGIAASVLGFCLSLALQEPDSNRQTESNLAALSVPKAVCNHIKHSIGFLFHNPVVAAVMVLSGLEGCCAYFGLQLMQQHLTSLQLSGNGLGAVLACVPLLGALGAWMAGRSKKGFAHWAVASCVAIGVGIAVAGAPKLGLALLGGGLASLMDGAMEIRVSSWLNQRLASSQRATLVSVQSMVYSTVMLPVSPLMGQLCQSFGFGWGLAIFGTGFLTLAALGGALWCFFAGKKNNRL